MNTTRTFIAVAISDAVRRRAQQMIEQLQTSGVKVRWVEPANMHVTLKFLGDVLNEQTIDVCRAVSKAVQGLTPFAWQCHGVGAFPDVKRPRTVWAGVSEGAQQMCQVQAAIERQLADLGFPQERRRYVPHVTLGRVRGTGRTQHELGELLEQLAETSLGANFAGEVLVMASYLASEGPHHEVLGRAPLSSGESS